MADDKVGAVLIVGGGISGMQSALDLADSDFKVYLLENKPSIGGVMAQLDKTFPTNDCAMCIMAPKLVATGRHNNIEIISNAEIEKVEGDVGHFKVHINKKPRKIDEEKCTGCGVCAEKCPVEALDIFNENLSPRSATSVLYLQAVPLVYSIDTEICIGCGICKEECKAGAVVYDEEERKITIDVGSIILSPGFDEFDPTVKTEYGYGKLPNVVSSIEFERILSATGPHNGIVLRPSDGDIPAEVAFLQCVGSRDASCGNEYCSAVCCMYAMKEAIIAQEHTEGLKSHIFFMDLRAFGKEFDDYYTRAQEEYGIEFTRCRVASIDEGENDNVLITYVIDDEVIVKEFNMVVLSVGLESTKTAGDLAEKFGIELNKYNFVKTDTFSPLETTRPGVYVSGAFSSPKDIPDTVAQASGAAAKASAVISEERGTLVTEKEYPVERDVSAEEPRIGVFVCHCGINIGGVVDVPDVVEYAKTLPNVGYSEHNLYTCSQDTQEGIKEKIKEHNLNRVIVASCTPRTHEPLFRATTKEGGLNPYLFEMANIRDQCSWVHMHEKEDATKKSKELVKMAVAKARLLEPLYNPTIDIKQEGLVIGGGLAGMSAALQIAEMGYETHLVEREKELGGNLKDIHFTLDAQKPPQEVLADIEKRIQDNPKLHVYLNNSIKNIEGFVGNFETTLADDTKIEHGIIVVATGGNEYKPTEYLYGQNDKVMTQKELEKKLAKGDVPKDSVVMIQCVGSRNEERPYCSRICCGIAIKNALKIKELSPETDIYVLYKDIRTYGFKEDYYREAAEKGVKFIRYDDENMPEATPDNGLTVKVKDPVLGDTLEFNPDALVLSVATLPQEDNEELAKMLKVPRSKDKFFLEAHMKLRPVEFATEGVFLCGLAHWPKFIDESISQANGAVSRACTILSKETLEVEGITSEVTPELCSGCGICVDTCPYNAIELKENLVTANESGAFEDMMVCVAEVNAALCKGCGSCAGACPSGAIDQKGFKSEQIMRVLQSALLPEESQQEVGD
jgi:heterodisulfide reductase subunit A